MEWRIGLRYASYVMLIVLLVSTSAWLVLWGYGELEMAGIALIISVVALAVGGILAQLSRIETTRVEAGDGRHTFSVSRPGHPAYRKPPSTFYNPGPLHNTAAPVRPPPETMARVLSGDASDEELDTLMDNMMAGPGLAPPGGTVISEEVNDYPTLYRTDMTVEEYDRWTEEFGPEEGEWREREIRRRREEHEHYSRR